MSHHLIVNMGNSFASDHNLIRQDLIFQLGMPEDLDWDYFLETSVRGKLSADLSGSNNSLEIQKLEALAQHDNLQFHSRKELLQSLEQACRLNWDSFVRCVVANKVLADQIGSNMPEEPRTVTEIFNDAEVVSYMDF